MILPDISAKGTEKYETVEEIIKLKLCLAKEKFDFVLKKSSKSKPTEAYKSVSFPNSVVT